MEKCISQIVALAEMDVGDNFRYSYAIWGPTINLLLIVFASRCLAVVLWLSWC